jgi:flavin reductase (DIM6/NTAB) family NADH-FMN oxidoreductase RutF
VTANAFTPVSLVPPLVLVCLSTKSSAARTITRNGVFAVNVLSGDQEWLSRRFASPTIRAGTPRSAMSPSRRIDGRPDSRRRRLLA